MDHEAVHLGKQDGVDGIWFKDCCFDVARFFELFDTEVYVVDGASNQFDGVGFRTKFKNKDVPFYFFTDLRNHKMERLGYEVVKGGRLDNEVVAKWYDNTPLFYATVFVKLWKRDVTSDVARGLWMEHWKALVLSEGLNVFSACAVLQRCLFFYEPDIKYMSRTLLHAVIRQNVESCVLTIGPGFAKYAAAAHGVDTCHFNRVCSFCGWYDGSKMRMCSCKSGVRYCSKKCQSVHWRMVHKKECAWKKE